MDMKKLSLSCVAILSMIAFGEIPDANAAPNPLKKMKAAAKDYVKSDNKAKAKFLKALNKYGVQLTPEQLAALESNPFYSQLDDSDGDGVLDVEEEDDGFNICDPDSDDDGIDDGDEDDDDDDDDGSSSSDDDSSSGSSSSGGSSSGTSSSGGGSSSSS